MYCPIHNEIYERYNLIDDNLLCAECIIQRLCLLSTKSVSQIEHFRENVIQIPPNCVSKTQIDEIINELSNKCIQETKNMSNELNEFENRVIVQVKLHIAQQKEYLTEIAREIYANKISKIESSIVYRNNINMSQIKSNNMLVDIHIEHNFFAKLKNLFHNSLHLIDSFELIKQPS